jgi:hypothetical protein
MCPLNSFTKPKGKIKTKWWLRRGEGKKALFVCCKYSFHQSPRSYRTELSPEEPTSSRNSANNLLTVDHLIARAAGGHRRRRGSSGPPRHLLTINFGSDKSRGSTGQTTGGRPDRHECIVGADSNHAGSRAVFARSPGKTLDTGDWERQTQSFARRNSSHKGVGVQAGRTISASYRF